MLLFGMIELKSSKKFKQTGEILNFYSFVKATSAFETSYW